MEKPYIVTKGEVRMARKVLEPREVHSVLYTIKFVEMKHSGNREWNSECYWDSYKGVVKHLESCGFKERDDMEFMKEKETSHIHALIRVLD